MTDRIPGAPGRCKAVVTDEELQKLQAGEEFAITLRRDDQPIKEGTPYSKAAVLPDTVAAKLCPGAQDPTPGDAFAALQSQKADAVRQGTGTVITLQDAAYTPLMGLKLFNKNLLPINEITFTGTYYYKLEKPIPAGDYYFYVGNITTTSTNNNCLIMFLNNGTRVASFQRETTNTNNVPLYVSSDITDIYFYASTSHEDSKGQTATYKDIMISVEGGAYAPYFGGGDVTVKVMGKNLWDEQTKNGQWADTTGQFVPNKYGISSANPIVVDSSMKLYNNGPCLLYAYFYDKDMNWISPQKAFHPNGGDVTPPANAKYMHFNIASAYGAEYKNDICIALSKTEYEPYKEQTLVVSVPNGLGNEGLVCEDYDQLHTYSPTTVISNDAGLYMEVAYYTPSTAVQMVHSPADKDKLFSIDEHGCAILVEREAITEKAMAALAQLETDVKNLDISDGALYVALDRHKEDTSNPHEVTAEQLGDMADFVVEQDTSGEMKWRIWNSGLAECWGEMSVSAEGSTSNTDHCNLFSDLPLYFAHFDSVQVTVLSTNPSDPGDSQYEDVLTNLFMSVFNIDAEAEQERLVVRFGVIEAGSYNMLNKAVNNVRLSVRVSGTM